MQIDVITWGQIALEKNSGSGPKLWVISTPHREASDGYFKEFSGKLEKNKESVESSKPTEECVSKRVWSTVKSEEESRKYKGKKDLWDEFYGNHCWP